MKITTKIYEESIKETIYKLIENKIKIRTLLIIFFFVIFLIINIITSNNISTVLIIIVIILQILSFIFLVKAKEDVALKAFNKTYPDGEYTLTMEVKKNEIAFTNDHFTNVISVKFDDLAQIKHSSNYYILILKNKTYFLINKKDINIEKFKKRIGKVK